LDFLYCFLFTYICLHFFSYSEEEFFILYKESEEHREIRNVRLSSNTNDSSILLITVNIYLQMHVAKKLISNMR